MCMSAEAFLLFLSLIAAPHTVESGRVVIHSDTRDVTWLVMDEGEKFCSTQRQIDGMEKIAAQPG